MEVEILARLQFALTIMFHYIYPPLSIGLGVIIVLTEAIYLKTREESYLNAAKYWTQIFALTFAVGVATGIVMEFEFGTNWSTYSRYVGDVFGSALAAEGVFAFFLESGFLALLLFGWNRIGPKLHFFSSVMVCLGAHFSAIWIVVANAWMQTPAGFKIVGEGMHARAEITSFWEMVFNPSSVSRLTHTIIGAWLAGAFLVISISAYYMLKERHPRFSMSSLKMGLSLSFIALILQAITGQDNAEIVAKYQPMKLAAFEGIFKTATHVPYTLLGVVDTENQTINYKVDAPIPGLLSYLAFDDVNAEIKGLDQIPRKDWPNVAVLFISYRTMIATWIAMLIVTLSAGWSLWRGTLLKRRGFLWVLVAAVLLPQIGNQVGWLCAEMGRYPWIVQGLLRISDGLSKSVTANHVLGSIIMFGIVYSFLFVMFIYILDKKIKKGPSSGKEDEHLYHKMHGYIEEVDDGK